MHKFDLLKDGSDGHLIIESAGKYYLIDTGSPLSLASSGVTSFLSEGFKFNGQQAGNLIRCINNHLQCDIDALIGTDVLKKFHVVVNTRSGVIAFYDDSPEFQGDEIDMPIFKMPQYEDGVPYLTVEINSRSYNLLVDTGAKIGYLPSAALAEYESYGREVSDFSPLSSDIWKTNIYKVSIDLAGDSKKVAFGDVDRLSSEFDWLKDSKEIDGIVGSELFKCFEACFDYSGGLMKLKSY